MGGGQETTTSTTGSASPVIRGTLDKLFGGLSSAYDTGAPPVFNSSLYTPAGATTQQGWTSTLNAAANPDYAAGTAGAIKSLGNAASGGAYGMNDPGYAALRQNAINDTQTAVNSQFNNSGRFGGGTHVGKLGEGISNTIAGLDYNNFQNDRNFQLSAANALPGAFQSSLLPSALQGSVGAAQDANQQGILQGNYDLFNRTNNNKTDWLSKLFSLGTGGAAAGGTTTTNTQPSTPLWQSLLGTGIGAAGLFL